MAKNTRPPRELVDSNRLILHGIPTRFHPWTLEDFADDSELYPFISEWLGDLPRVLAAGEGLFFCGPNGVGKTTLGSIILREALLQGYSVQMAPWPSVIDARTQCWNSQEARQDFRYKIYETRLLQLDDVGKELGAGKELSRSVLDQVLRRREGRQYSTIITTNSSAAGIKELYGESIASLMNGMITVEVHGVDRRGQR